MSLKRFGMNTEYMPSVETKKICVIGGGPAGMMAGGTASLYGAEVTLFEHTGRLGKKLAITGKGRCNVTNDAPNEKILENITKNQRFMYSALNAFSAEDTMSFFENAGVPLKVERGNRVFPVSDKASDIVDAMRGYISSCNKVYSKVTAIKKAEHGFTVLADKEYHFDSVIIATGGKSYPKTGSDGSGYKLAIKLGHTVTELKPSLIPLESSSPLCARMQGLSLKNVGIRAFDKSGKTLYSDFGEMMFTHFGVTGPMILSASSYILDKDFSEITISVDLKPALDEQTLDTRLLSDFAKSSNKDFKNALGALLPSKMIEPFIDYCGVDERKKVNLITKEERRKIRTALKDFRIPITRPRPIDEAIITSGGISVKEINPKTMESKILPNLYFAGEIIDVDAYTGGFNLQIAFSTGYLAGKSAAEKIED